MEMLRIATFNTWNCQGPFDNRLPSMVAGLRALGADVILLQEVFAEAPSGLDVSAHLAGALGMNTVYAPARKKLRKLNDVPVLSHSGLAVLARGPIGAHESVQLPDDERDGERLGQMVQVKVRGVDVVIGNVHLSHLPGQDDLRRRQLVYLAEHLKRFGGDMLRFAGGDMNAPAGHDIFDVLDGFTPLSVPGDGMRTTLNPVGGKPLQAGIIDHLFVSDPNGRVRETHVQVALHQPDGVHGVFPSDHRAVVADVALE